MNYTADCKSPDWLKTTCFYLETLGFAVVENVLPAAIIDRTCNTLFEVREKIKATVGEERLKAAEWNVLLLLMKYDQYFYTLLETQPMLALVDEILSPSAILRVQGGSVIPPIAIETSGHFRQSMYHTNFRWDTAGYRVTLDFDLPLKGYDQLHSLHVVPGSHLQNARLDPDRFNDFAFAIQCNPGDMIVLNSGLWHKDGVNHSDTDRFSLLHQFTRPFCKPYLDYVRALGREAIELLPERSRHLLGLYTQVPTSLEEYYLPMEERLFKTAVL